MQLLRLGSLAMGVSILVGCSTTGFQANRPVDPGAQQAISEQRLDNNYKRQGVRVIYSTFGDLIAIEATGYAAVWGNSENAAREAYRVAELEAKKSMNEFINKESVQSSTSVTMVSRNLERASDNKSNNISTNNKTRDLVSATSTDEDLDQDTQKSNSLNKAVRNDALSIASKLNTSIKTSSRGILTGLYLVEGETINEGKTVRVVYRWDRRSTKDIDEVRKLMSR